MYPMQLSFQRFQADEQGWVDTIKSVRFGGAVRISTMDWLGQSQYLRQTVFWPSLSSAVSELLKQVIFSKHALVNMLVTYWSHFLDGTDEYLKSILYSTILCHSSSRNNCKGRVNIKYYIVPGYKKTGAAKSNKDRCADDKLKKMALRVIAESLSEEEIAGLKEAIPCDGHQQQRLVNDEKEEKEKKGNGGEKKSDGEKKKEEGQTVVEVKFDLHCEGCAHKGLSPDAGVESVNADPATNRLKVTGKVDPWQLKELLEAKTKKKVEFISPKDPPKKSKEEDKKNKAEDGKDKEPKKEEAKPKPPEATTVVLKIRLHCDGCIHRIKKHIYKIKVAALPPAAQAAAAQAMMTAVAEANRMDYYAPHPYAGGYGYRIEMVHAPQMFSDENPNACCIM
ncbi:hypothetical protein ZIOFF_018409 [Zingiber officinale]|uniref:HMA domain-containing protein n=1 Tax=Zingiber officinale TaxID=94328 RepID=A0A8J5LM32_ZINOF|nr:hypothetical protein ZIOFF_018409 [Zingiber officinale]